MSVAAFVYILCTMTSGSCAALLFRRSRTAQSRLLFWSGASFACITIANVLLFVDLILFPQNDLLLLRNLVNLASICLLLYGLIWETK